MFYSVWKLMTWKMAVIRMIPQDSTRHGGSSVVQGDHISRDVAIFYPKQIFY